MPLADDSPGMVKDVPGLILNKDGEVVISYGCEKICGLTVQPAIVRHKIL